MPKSTVVELPPEEQAGMLAARRRAQYGYLLALPIGWLCARGCSPTEMAAVLFGSRSRVDRVRRAYRAGTLGLGYDAQGRLTPPVRTTVLLPTLRRSRLAVLQVAPRAHGWCRTRWSGATLALTLEATRGLKVSAETRRRWLHEIGWVWKRAKLVANADELPRVHCLARIRFIDEQGRRCAVRVCADERAIHLLPKVGSAWMPRGSQLAVLTPGQTETHALAGALALSTGTVLHCLGPHKPNALCRARLGHLEARYPAEQSTRLSVVVDNYKIHQAKAVDQGLARHPRITLLWLPT
jgi:hypothetical protein